MKSIMQRISLLFCFSVLISAIPFLSIAKQITPLESAENIYSIIQDEKDFIWLAGQNGLYRYSDSQLINFSRNKKDWPLPFNWIKSLSIKGEQLILGTETKGLWLFNTNTGLTKPINIQSKSKTFYKAITHKDSIYALGMTPQHLYHYEPSTDKTTIVMHDIENSLLIASKNRIYFDDDGKLFYINSNVAVKKKHLVEKINEGVIASASTNNTVIFASNKHLFKLSDNGTFLKVKTLSPTLAIAISNDKNSFFTVDRAGEIIKRDLNTLRKIHSTFPSVEKFEYQSLLHDKSGVLWLVNHGSVQLLTENTVKNHHATFGTEYNSLETEFYNNQLYIGSYGKGVHVLPLIKKNQVVNINSINDQLSKKALHITDLLTINDDLFIASFDGLWRYNSKKNQIDKIQLITNKAILSQSILLKLVHKNNLLFIATDTKGLIVYDLNTDKVDEHINTSTGISSGEIIDVLPLANGDIWLATAVGVDVIKYKSKSIKTVKSQTSAKFLSIISADGKIFAATGGDGIFVYNQQGQLLTHFAKGINFNYMSIIDGYIFASAKPGLYEIDPKNYQISMTSNTEKYSFTDSPLLHKNSIYIANRLGILQLSRSAEKAFHPKVYISKTTVSGKPYLLNKAIEITSSNDVVTLDLASLDYRPGVNKKFRYTLNGGKWHQISGHQLTLTGLASGNYHIEIMATNSLGQWSNYKAYTEINVAFPWYWTPQIRLVYAIALFFIICFSVWLFYLHSKSIRHIHTILQNDISNYGKTSIQVKRNLTVALAFLDENKINKSKTLLQQCVDELNEQQQSPEPNSLNGNPLSIAIPFLAEYLQNKYQTTLSFQFDVNENELEYELQADLYRVVFEAITSAILKGSGCNFKVVIQKFKTKIWLNISDDNQSFINFNSKVNIDISMYYIQRIASKYQGSINTFNEQGNGSQLILSLPIKRHNY